jgi:hypothetical protein
VYHRHHTLHSCGSLTVVHDRGQTAKHRHASAVHEHGQ